MSQNLSSDYWLNVWDKREIIEVKFKIPRNKIFIHVHEVAIPDKDPTTYHMKLIIGDSFDIKLLHATDELISLNNINVQSIGIETFKKMLWRCQGDHVTFKISRFTDDTDLNNVYGRLFGDTESNQQ